MSGVAFCKSSAIIAGVASMLAFNARNQRLGDTWELGRILHIDDQNAGALATIGNEIGRLRVLLFKYLLDYFEAILRRCIPSFDWKRNLYQEPHALSFPPKRE